MKLRGRFTIWFALAALLPIVVAALVTWYVLDSSYREEDARTRSAAEQAVRGEKAALEAAVARHVDANPPGKLDAPALGSKDHKLLGFILRELGKGPLDGPAQRQANSDSGQVLDDRGLDVLLITGPGDVVLAAPHYPVMVGERDQALPQQHARTTAGRPFYTWVELPDASEPVLVVAAARFVSDGAIRVAVEVGQRVDAKLIESVRRPGRIDARIVADDGRVIVAPAEEAWAKLAASGTTRIALSGPDAQPVAWIELATSRGQLAQLRRSLTWVSVGLAVVALLLTVALGVLVARRMTRDLDRLVVGAQAAARGDLEHRVAASSKDEVGEVAAAFNLMMEDLRTAKERAVVAERIAAWQEVARRLAHEVKNPLTPIQMAMETLRKTWSKKHPSFDEVFEESTATVLEEADRLKRIVSEFSEFARMPKPTFGATDIGDVVSSALALYQGAVPVERKLADGLPSIEADRGQITQVLLNLLENARDALSTRPDAEGGRILVTTRKGDAGDRIEITVEDNGPGVPADIKDRMFTPYFTTKGPGGTGLGLAIVHRIVSDHGGRVVVGDAAGGGARFAIELPLRQGATLLASRV